jgi:hypothetical protein
VAVDEPVDCGGTEGVTVWQKILRAGQFPGLTPVPDDRALPEAEQ